MDVVELPWWWWCVLVREESVEENGAGCQRQQMAAAEQQTGAKSPDRRSEMTAADYYWPWAFGARLRIVLSER